MPLQKINESQNTKYIKQGDTVYLVESTHTQEELIAEYDDRMVKLQEWKESALKRIEKDYNEQMTQLRQERKEIEKL